MRIWTATPQTLTFPTMMNKVPHQPYKEEPNSLEPNGGTSWKLQIIRFSIFTIYKSAIKRLLLEERYPNIPSQNESSSLADGLFSFRNKSTEGGVPMTKVVRVHNKWVQRVPRPAKPFAVCLFPTLSTFTVSQLSWKAKCSLKMWLF